ncbi:MAG TPA: hypothetical protein VH231_02900 [Solirubrobacteraceae bacterium]|nr:hypothetical protein [Solirubrobacteraceae bacterium]
MRALLAQEPCPPDAHYCALPPDLVLAPGPRAIPLWVASWGSPAGLARVAQAGDGWLASAYNTTPERFAGARAELSRGDSPSGAARPRGSPARWPRCGPG